MAYYSYFNIGYTKIKQYQTTQEIKAYVLEMKNTPHYRRLLKQTDKYDKRDLKEWNTLITKYIRMNTRPTETVKEQRRINAKRWRENNKEYIKDYNKGTYRRRLYEKTKYGIDSA